MKAGLILLSDKSEVVFQKSSDRIFELLEQQFEIKSEHFFKPDWNDGTKIPDYYNDIIEHIKVCINSGLEDVIIWYIGHGFKDPQNNLYISLDGTPVKEPELNSDFSLTVLLKKFKRQNINKWIFLDCCYSAAIQNAVNNESKAIVVCASGDDIHSKIKIEGALTRLTSGLNELLTSPIATPLSISNIKIELEKTKAFKDKASPHIVYRDGKKLIDRNFFHRHLLNYPGCYFETNNNEPIESDLFLNLCSSSAHALIISHRTGSIQWKNLQETTKNLSAQFRKFCTDPTYFKSYFKELHGIPPLLIYVLDYPEEIDDRTGSMKALYNFTMLKTMLQIILMSSPNSNTELSLLNPEINRAINVDSFASEFDFPDLYNELKLWHWFSFRCCFVVKGFKIRSKTFIDMMEKLKKFQLTEHLLMHCSSGDEIDGDSLNLNVNKNSILETQLPNYVKKEDFKDTTNIKENLESQDDQKENSGFGLYSTLLIENIEKPMEGIVDLWKWSILKGKKDELSVFDPKNDKVTDGAKLVWLGSLHKLLFCDQKNGYDLNYCNDNDKYKTLIKQSKEARNQLDELGFSVLNVAEFLSEPSFNRKFPTGKIQ